jgi:quinol monooxygenase YgiN
MITAIVTYKRDGGPASPEQIKASQEAAKNFRDIPGLIRKNFLYSEDGIGGGVYTWENREAAEAFYSSPRMQEFEKRVGPVDIQYFETHVIVDNERGELKTAA